MKTIQVKANIFFKINLYVAIVKYKTAVYSFYLPFASGMLAAGHRPDCEIMVRIFYPKVI